jgi:hypothetical protein
MVKRSVADPESGAFLTPIFDSSETIFFVKIFKFFDADPDPGSWNLFYPGSGMEKNTDPG